jgi:hypothetical protein
MLKVIFACVHNAGRSQMAAAFFNQLADRTKAEAVSAGTEPGLKVHPEVLAAMQEIGIGLSLGRTLRTIGDFSGLNVPLQSVISKYRREKRSWHNLPFFHAKPVFRQLKACFSALISKLFNRRMQHWVGA